MPHSPYPGSVFASRSSNRTCGFPASGSRREHHAFAHGKLRVRSSSLTSPSVSYRYSAGKRAIPVLPSLCLRRNHCRSRVHVWLSTTLYARLIAGSSCAYRLRMFPSLSRVTWSHVSESLGVTRLSPISGPSVASTSVSTKAPSLHRHYPASSVLRASPPPCPTRPVPHGTPVRGHSPSNRASRVASGSLCIHAIATTPAEPVGASLLVFPTNGSLPEIKGRSASAACRFEACSAFTARYGLHAC